MTEAKVRRLAKLIVDTAKGVSHDGDWTSRQQEIRELLEQAIVTARLRIAFRNALQDAATDTNEVSVNQIAEVLKQVLADEITAAETTIAEAENRRVPAVAALGTGITGALAALGAIAYGTADLATGGAISAGFGLVAYASRRYASRIDRARIKALRRRAQLAAMKDLL